MPFNAITDANGNFQFLYVPAPGGGQSYDIAVQPPGGTPLIFAGAISFAPGDPDVVLADLVMQNTTNDPNNCGACGNVCPNGSACVNSSCVAPPAVCGNGVREGNEQCDDGNSNNQDGCNVACTVPACGNAILDQGEQCDDGNQIVTDACTNSCQNAFCGDGHTRIGVEQCDDGNTVNGDGCSAACTSEQQQLLPLGSACASSSSCQSTFCVDGFCANSACNSLCLGASQAKTGQANGICAPIMAGTDPDSECSAQGANTCGTTGVCNGAGSCQLYPAGTQCGAATCSNGVASQADFCNGTGTCVQGATMTCAPFSCNPNGTCNISCNLDNQCAQTSYCNASQCVPKRGSGSSCDRDAQCVSGSCSIIFGVGFCS